MKLANESVSIELKNGQCRLPLPPPHAPGSLTVCPGR